VLVAALAALILEPPATHLKATDSTGPHFVVEASQDVSADFTSAPRLHSFVSAQWEGKWIFIGGRTGGYHGVGQGDVDFPRSRANLKIWVIEPPGLAPAKVYSIAVAELPDSLAAVKDQWVSTSLLHFQDKDTLYLAGGYGENSSGEMVTYPILSSVNLPALVRGVTKGKDTFSSTVSYVKSPLVQSTGGELLKLDDGLFYLVGGHVFMGSYRAFEAAAEKTTPKVSQTYLSEIRKLRIVRSAGKLEVSLVERFQDPEFARRDLNVAMTIQPDGKTLGGAAYGGVFTKDQLNFAHPIYFSATAKPKVDASYEQKMSAYTCAKLLMFDPDTSQMYTTFFGGISRWIWNYASRQFELAPKTGDKSMQTGYLDGMPWIDHISTLARGKGQTMEFVQQDNRLPAYVGSNAVFLPAAGLKTIREDAPIYDLRQFAGKRTLVGYIYGGIRASPKQFPYTDEAPSYTSGNIPTKPSDLVLKVYVTAPPFP
jgi:hypothetical protein